MYVLLDGDLVDQVCTANPPGPDWLEVICTAAPETFSPPSGAVGAPFGLTPREAKDCCVVAGILTPRPLSPSPVEVTGGWSVHCVAGTNVQVIDVTGEEVMLDHTATATEALDFSLPDPGEYRIEVRDPTPALPSITTLEVQA